MSVNATVSASNEVKPKIPVRNEVELKKNGST